MGASFLGLGPNPLTPFPTPYTDGGDIVQHVSETFGNASAKECVDNRGEGSRVGDLHMVRRRAVLGRVWGMKIELVEVAEDAALGQQAELWLRIVSANPLGPDDYRLAWGRFDEQEKDRIIDSIKWGAGYKFFVDLWDEDDEDREDHGFEQWWVFTRKDVHVGHNLD